MRIFHLSDLHIGIRLYNRDLREDQIHLFDQIIEKVREYSPDVVLIAGDIYDKAVPSAEAVQLFDSFMEKLTGVSENLTVMLISGNHDSAQRLDCYRWILKHQNVYQVGLPPQREGDRVERVTLTDTYGDVNFYLLPFLRPSSVRLTLGVEDTISYDEAVHMLIRREEIDLSVRNVIVSHQFYLPVGKSAEEMERMDSEVKSVGNVDAVSADILEQFDYAALGHIHKPMTVGKDHIRYCGTPMPMSVSEAGQKKGILMVDLKEKGVTQITKIPLTPLHEIRVVEGLLRDVLKEECQDYVTVILTDEEDLETVDLQERLRRAFPRLLEIQRKNLKGCDFQGEIDLSEKKDPFSLISLFLNNMDEEESKIIQNVILLAEEEMS